MENGKFVVVCSRPIGNVALLSCLSRTADVNECTKKRDALAELFCS